MYPLYLESDNIRIEIIKGERERERWKDGEMEKETDSKYVFLYVCVVDMYVI